jgi:hypothetical protein
MKDSPSPSSEAEAKKIKYCDRCARRSPALFFDRLKRKRGVAIRPEKPTV